MLYNKNRFRKINDKKVLHKIKKHWVTLSVALLGLVGGGAVTATNVSANTNADEQGGDVDQANHQVNSKNIQSSRSQLVGNGSASVNGQSTAASASSAPLTTQKLTKRTNQLSSRILLGATRPGSASASNNSSSAAERVNTSTAMGGSFSSSVDPAQFIASANTEMDSIVGATNNVQARDKSLRADSSEMSTVSSYDSINQSIGNSFANLDISYNSDTEDIKRDVSSELSYSNQIQAYTSALSTKASNVDKNYDNTERNDDVTSYYVSSSEVDSYNADKASLTSVINATLSSASAVYQDAAQVVVTSNSSADASAARSAAESSAAAAKISSAQSASASRASTASSIANVSSTDASIANVINSDSANVSSYDEVAISDDNTILDDLSDLKGDNPKLSSKKAIVLSYIVKNAKIASVENSYVTSFANQTRNPDLYKNSKAIKDATELSEGAHIIEENASLVATKGIESLRALASANADSSTASNSVASSSSSAPSSFSSSSVSFSNTASSDDSFNSSIDSTGNQDLNRFSSSVAPINVTVPPKSTSVFFGSNLSSSVSSMPSSVANHAESSSNGPLVVFGSSASVNNATSKRSVRASSVAQQSAGSANKVQQRLVQANSLNQKSDGTTDVIAQVKNPTHWFYVDKTCLAHNNLSSVGHVKNYSMVLHRGFVAKVVKTLAVKHAGKTVYRYEINVNNHNYFVTGNSTFTKNAYVQPDEVTPSHKAEVLTPCFTYNRIEYSPAYRTYRVHRGQLLNIKRIVQFGNPDYHMTRIQLEDGTFITANRKFIKML